MKRKATLLLSVVFLLVLFCPHILWSLFFEKPAEDLEKRTLAEKPVFSLEAAYSFPKEYEEYYNDHLPFRDLMIKLYNNMLYHVFHTSSSEDVLIGKDGWLFYSSATDGASMQCYDGSLLFTDEELEQIANNLMDAKSSLAEHGAEFIVFIAPSKERIYSEYMPDYLGGPAQECMVNQVIAYLKEHTDIRVVYPYEELMAYKQGHEQPYLYYQTDTHWNDLGAYIGSRALLAEIGVDIASPDEAEVATLEPGFYDLARLLNLKGLKDHGHSLVVYDPVQEIRTLSDEEYGRMEYDAPGAADIRLFMHRIPLERVWFRI